MKKIFGFSLFALLTIVAFPVAAQNWRVGWQASSMMPSGGADVKGGVGGGITAGCDITENFGLEADVVCHGHTLQFGAEGIWRWQGSSLYSDFFGYSRFDPFSSLGISCVVGRGGDQAGPKAGVGAYYHLDNNWSLRFDADAVLALAGRCEMVFSVSAGVVYSF